MVPMGGNKVSANPELMEKHPEVYTSMGATAENVAARFKVSREDAGRVRLREPAPRGARRATSGKFKDEIVPVKTTRLRRGRARRRR